MSNCEDCKGYGIVEDLEREILESKERIVWEIEWYFLIEYHKCTV